MSDIRFKVAENVKVTKIMSDILFAENVKVIKIMKTESKTNNLCTQRTVASPRCPQRTVPVCNC